MALKTESELQNQINNLLNDREDRVSIWNTTTTLLQDIKDSKEHYLNVPMGDGYILASTSGGTRYWIQTTGLTSINNLTQSSQFLTTGSTGIDFQIISSGNTHIFNIPTASSGSTRGLLSGTDWLRFNAKQNTLGYTPLSGNTIQPGTYNTILVDSKGLVVSGTNINYLTSFTQTLQNIVYQGDVYGSGTTGVTLTLNSITTGTTVGSGTQIPIITYDDKGRIVSSYTQQISTGITLSYSSVTSALGYVPYNSTNPQGFISGNTVQSGTFNNVLVDSKGLVVSGSVINYLTSFTQVLQNNIFSGDVYGSGTTGITLTLNSITSGTTVGSSTQIPIITYDNKGRITSAYTLGIQTTIISGSSGQLTYFVSGSPFIGSSSGLTFDPVNNRLGIGNIINPSATTHILSTTEQLRLGYDNTHYLAVSVDSGSGVFFNSIGNPSATFNFNFPLIVSNGIRTNGTFQNANLTVPSGAGPVGTVTTPQYLFGGASGVTFRVGFRGSGAAAIGINESHSALLIGQQGATIAASGTHNIFASQTIRPLGVVLGAGVLNNNVTLYIDGSSTGGTNNYSLWVDGGVSRFSSLSGATTQMVIVSATGVLSTQPIPTFNRIAVTSSTYSATSINFAGRTILGMSFASGRTVTLPVPSGITQGTVITVKDEAGSASLFNIVVNAQGGALIEFAPTDVLNINGMSKDYYTNGTNYFVI